MLINAYKNKYLELKNLKLLIPPPLPLSKIKKRRTWRIENGLNFSSFYFKDTVSSFGFGRYLN